MTPTSTHDHVKLGDHDHQLQLFNMRTDHPSSSNISTHVLSYSNIQDQAGSYYPRKAQKQKYEEKANNLALECGSPSDQDLKLCLWKNDNGQGYKISSHRHHNVPTKWLPSKLRLVRRMMESNQTDTKLPADFHNIFEEHNPKQGSASPVETTENSSNCSSSTPVRVCSDCNTTKTPLWRSGPRGPKSLCNACGIRQRKARRALAAAAAAANGTTLEAEGIKPSKPKVQQHKDKRLQINTKILPSKKRSRLSNNNGRNNKLCFEDFLINLSKNLAFHQVFPQDEKEAAILLMALSCGLVHG